MSKRISFLVHGGTVQGCKPAITCPPALGVNFRWFTQKAARENNLTGWVRNAPNEKVEGEAQGDDTGIQKLVKEIKQGPRHAHVVKVETKGIEMVEGEEGFEVRH